ncbi:hypothetical protein JHK85_015411 [Glycine max]|nr:hypothetical protein JHK85_015411 [Glycine max]
MLQTRPGGSGGRTVLVGVKMDSPSKELLTWALVKVAHPGDTVVALHVLGNNETVNGDGKSSLLSLVKAFDSVLAAYKGFCNLKQVDLKLKICRGSSVKKTLVREANGYSATHVVVGTTHGLHKIRSSTVVAKHCAKKLSKDCCVLAVNNGKVVFKRDSSPPSVAELQGVDRHNRNGLLGSIHWTLGKNRKVLSDDSSGMDADEKKTGPISDHSLAKFFLESKETVRNPSCSICGTTLALPDPSFYQSAEGVSGDEGRENSLAMVPVQPTVAAKTELKPGWPLLDGRILSDRQSAGRSLFHLQISVVQWAMRLPSRNLSYAVDRDEKSKICDQGQDQPAALDSESGALVLVDAELGTASSPENNSGNIPKELEGLHEKYSSTCRLFEYQELVSATSNFLHENLIGKGGSSQVYRGCLPDGKELAVKILNPSDDLSDFGLAKWASTLSSHITCTDVAGTFGYLAPEYFMYGKVNDKIDVYAFGVVLLELLSGRKPISRDYPKGQESLVMWASPILNSGKVLQLLDPSLGDNYDHEEMEKIVLAATLCIKRAPRARPQMNLISKLLQGDAEAIKWARLQVNALDPPEMLDDEACPPSNLQSHINLALLDVEDDLLSMCSVEQGLTLEDYLRGRWSRASSFD